MEWDYFLRFCTWHWKVYDLQWMTSWKGTRSNILFSQRIQTEASRWLCKLPLKHSLKKNSQPPWIIVTFLLVLRDFVLCQNLPSYNFNPLMRLLLFGMKERTDLDHVLGIHLYFMLLSHFLTLPCPVDFLIRVFRSALLLSASLAEMEWLG